MKLVGILENSLGGFTCIRGYAPLEDLAKVSVTPSFQRQLIEEHKQEIIEFLKRGQHLFFPEIVLSYKLNYDFSKGESGINPLREVQELRTPKKIFTLNIDPITFKCLKADPQLIEIDLNEKFISKNKPFYRLDGNHRMSSYEQVKEESLNLQIAPFCLIIQENIKSSEATEMAIFHNINFKARPLSSEDNLRFIIDRSDLFADEKLKEPSFGWEYFFTRKAIERIDLEVLTYLENSLNNNQGLRTTLTKLFKLLLDKHLIEQKEGEINKVLQSLNSINQAYQDFENKRLADSTNSELLIAFIYFKMYKKGINFEAFLNWVIKNNIFKVTATPANELIEIFEAIISARSKQIFVSMQFCPETEPTYKSIRKVIDIINRENNQDIALREVRIDQFNKGYSYEITSEILELINSSGLLIADLDYGNKNVYHELGYLMGLNQGRRQGQDNFILLFRERPNLIPEENIGFNIRHIQQLRWKETNDLEEKLSETIKRYYSLII